MDFKKFMYRYKKLTAKPYFFLVIDATLDDLSRFIKNLLEIIWKLIKATDNEIKDEKL